MAGLGGNMMASARMEAFAESGFGVTISGFHAPSLELNARLAEYLVKMDVLRDVVVHEEQGYISLLLLSSPAESPKDHDPLLVTYRREVHKFFQDLGIFLASTRARSIQKMTLSGSLGSLCLTLLYHPVPRLPQEAVSPGHGSGTA